jgi:hypothetical protein
VPAPLATPASPESRAPLLALLEPGEYLDTFMRHPPIGFTAAWSPSGMPTFEAPFDLLMTLDEPVRQRIQSLPLFRHWGRLLSWRTRFAGSTVTEYAPLPAGLSAEALVQELLRTYGSEHRLLIVKDIAADSPLLDARENAAVRAFVQALELAGFVMVEGNSLGWMSIDFDSIESCIATFSAGRRSDVRRKLRIRKFLQEDILRTGSAVFQDEAFIDQLYRLYVNVYEQSDVHFDVLDREFFRQLFQDASNDGLLFTYRRDGQLIGWKLCYEHAGKLLDKYLGFQYPQSRDNNLYYVSWFHCLEYALQKGLSHYVAGWTDARIKRYLGAHLTRTRHAVYVRNPVLRWCFRRLSHHFEAEPG